MSSPHSPYEKMAEAVSDWLVDEAGLRRLARLDWVVTEKIHGANFSLRVSSEGVRAAKRKAVLEPGEDFYGHAVLVEALEPALQALLAALTGEHPGLRAVQVYGELFGGHYPHPEVPPAPGAQPVQTGVWYCPDIRFLAFDVALVVDGEEERSYLRFDRAREAMLAAGVPCVEPLFTGSYQEAMDHPVDFDSRVPAQLGLPPLEEPNRAEGVVVKPVEPVLIETRRGRARPVLKRKIPDFSEDARYHQAAPPPKAEDGAAGYALDLLEWELRGLLNPNRLAAARSKAGPTAPAHELRELLLEDVREELEAKHGGLLRGLSVEDRELLEALALDGVEELIESGTLAP